MNRELKAVYCVSDLFAEPCAVSMASLFENNREFEQITVFVIQDGMTQENQERLQKLAVMYGREAVMIPMPDPAAFFEDPRFTVRTLGHTFARMIVGQLLPKEVTRLLCLDSDMLILDSLIELWNTEMGGAYLAGVDSAPGKAMMEKTLRIKPGTPYLNGGLYLMNLEKIRQDGIEKRYVDYIRQMFDVGAPLGAYEEEVMNRCCLPHTLRLHPRYNLMTVNLVMRYDEFVRFRGAVNFYSREEMEEAVRHPAIIHAINTFYIEKRIWEKDSDSPYRDQYVDYRLKTPWASMPPMETRRTLKQKMMKKVWHLMSRRLAFQTAAFVRNEVRPRLIKKRDDE